MFEWLWYSWDPVFEPKGYSDTYAEMDKQLKNTISHRYRALELVRQFFATLPDV